MTQAQDCWAANLTASASALDFGTDIKDYLKSL